MSIVRRFFSLQHGNNFEMASLENSKTVSGNTWVSSWNREIQMQNKFGCDVSRSVIVRSECRHTVEALQGHRSLAIAVPISNVNIIQMPDKTYARGIIYILRIAGSYLHPSYRTSYPPVKPICLSNFRNPISGLLTLTLVPSAFFRVNQI